MKNRPQKPHSGVPRKSDPWIKLGPAILFAVALLCYAAPLISDEASIQWDAADYYGPTQKYFSDSLHQGRIPFWSPYPFSGHPFLQDPQVGAFYPLNWPFFLIGVTPRLLVVEHFLHVLMACFGAYFLALRLVPCRPGAVLAGLCYGLSGYAVGHSSHTTMLQSMGWLPWLLLLYDRFLETKKTRDLALAALASGIMILAGHFQTALYIFLALGLFALVRAWGQPRSATAIFGGAAALPIAGALISAVATLPGLELTVWSVRTAVSALAHHEGQLPFTGLANLVAPNFYNIFSDEYTGPVDRTQFYLYSGIALVPLAIFGLRNRALRAIGLALILPTVWYSFGHAGGLYLLLARLPGFGSVRSPVHVWLVPILGLALLAAAGLAELSRKWPALPAVVVAITCIDLFHFQSAINPLAYSRSSYSAQYGQPEDTFRRLVTEKLPPLSRFGAPDMLYNVGPLAHYLDTRTEVTYGYNPLTLSRYADYLEAMKTNPSLRQGLNVGLWYDTSRNALSEAKPTIGRASFPKTLIPVRSPEDCRERLRALNQEREALVPDSVFVAAQDGAGTAEVREFAPGHYRIHYRCARESLLRVSNSYYPGWTAVVAGRNLAVVPVDHALMGVVVPAGESDIVLDYHSTYFVPGLLITVVTVLACVSVAFGGARVGSGQASVSSSKSGS